MGEGSPVRGWGYIDRRGKAVIAPQFEGAGPSAKGLVRVKMDGRWGYMDHRGEFVWRSTDCNADSYALDFMERKNP